MLYNIVSGIVCGLCMVSACFFCYETIYQDYRDFVRLSEAQHTYNTECPICLTTYKKEEIIYKTSCKHGFHVECYDSWVDKDEKNEMYCPFCQQDLVEYI